MRIAIVIPAFNEAESLPGLLASLKTLQSESIEYHIVVVDDGSSDESAAVVRKHDITLLSLPVNLGVGAAVQTGLIYALQEGFDYAVQVDGDGQHPADQIPLIVGALPGRDLVIGSRFLGTGSWRSSVMRRLGIRLLNAQLRILCGLHITDCTSGFRGFSRKAIKLAADHYPDQYPEPESIVLFHNHGLIIAEVAVHMLERSEGRSSIRALLPLYYMLKVSLAIFFTYLRTKFGRHG